MTIREATPLDTSSIVCLLKTSLGERLLPKSERYWMWKHLENPFGPSEVLVSEEDDKVVGVRACMKWRWRNGNKIFHAVRGVDAATHPAYQGRGIFRKLTLDLVDQCMAKGDQFVFNTPNDQSRPGYLKMGWTVAGRLPIVVQIRRPINMMKNLMVRETLPVFTDDENSVATVLAHPGLSDLLRNRLQNVEMFSTDVSIDYLSWRYRDVPVVNYFALTEKDGDALTGLIIGRIKATPYGKELRVTDCFLHKNSTGKELMKKLTDLNKKCAIDYITLSGTQLPGARKLFAFPTLKVSVGPVVTTRTLLWKDLTPFHNFQKWSPSLGDLELF